MISLYTVKPVYNCNHIRNLFVSTVSLWGAKVQLAWAGLICWKCLCLFLYDYESIVWILCQEVMFWVSVAVSWLVSTLALRYLQFERLWFVSDGLRGLVFITSECFCNIGRNQELAAILIWSTESWHAITVDKI